MSERILGAGWFIGFVVRDVAGFYQYDEVILIFGVLMSMLYLVAYWWVNKPEARTARTVIVTILYGFSFSCIAFAILFKLLFLTGSDQMTFLALIFMLMTLMLDFALSINKSKVINRRAIRRLSILIPVLAVLFFINDDKRIRFTYRSDPEFIRYYEDNIKSFPSFYDLREAYQATHAW